MHFTEGKGVEFPTGRFFLGENLFWEISGGKIFQEKLYNSISCLEMLRVSVQGIVSLGLNCLDDISMGMGDFSMEVEPEFPCTIQKSNVD